MAEQNNYTVQGYHFTSAQDARVAEEEGKKIQYLEEKLAGRSTSNLLSIYDKVLDEKMFITPIGWTYLIQLRQRIIDQGIAQDLIRPVPLYVSFAFENPETKESKGVAREWIRPSVKKKKTMQAKLRFSTILNVVLMLLVVAMFVITLQGENANAINYRRAIINEYASWEQELSEREKAVKEKEEMLQGSENIMDEKKQNSQK